jgi:D-alanyl-D-alanine carboxypeptidase
MHGRPQHEGERPKDQKPARGLRIAALLSAAAASVLLWPATVRGEASVDGHPDASEHQEREQTQPCREQAAQAFLIRSSWFPTGANAEDLGKAKAMQEHAIRFRTEKYGFFPGFGKADWNAHPPAFYAKSTSFMGLPVQVNQKIIPALACVERALKKTPALLAYHPQGLSGLRLHNTYRGGEVSNHVYGIAVDIDPNLNTCCGCVAPWNRHPLCQRAATASTPFDRMAMPKGWVETFERYGFYWLGHDVLRDTMHFEFLGDPDKL